MPPTRILRRRNRNWAFRPYEKTICRLSNGLLVMQLSRTEQNDLGPWNLPEALLISTPKDLLRSRDPTVEARQQLAGPCPLGRLDVSGRCPSVAELGREGCPHQPRVGSAGPTWAYDPRWVARIGRQNRRRRGVSPCSPISDAHVLYVKELID